MNVLVSWKKNMIFQVRIWVRSWKQCVIQVRASERCYGERIYQRNCRRPHRNSFFMIQHMYRAGIPIEKIGEVSGKTAEEIQEILKEK